MAIILDGRTLAMRIRQKIQSRIHALPTTPGLAVLLVGDNPASHTYVNIKQRACEEVGIRFERYEYESKITESTLIEKIHELNAREDIHGILVQLPLPTQNASRVIDAINPLKDVDGFHPDNLQRLKTGQPCIASAVALGIMKLIDDALKRLIDLHPTTATIIASPLFSEPLTLLLKERHIHSTIIAPASLEPTTKITADMVIVAVGQPGLITGQMIQPGSIIIDVGTTKIDGKLYGDVDFASVEPVAGALTPVPGGVGPMTVAMLLVNVLKAYDLQQRHNLK